MAKCNFTIPFENSSEEFYLKMKALIERKGGEITEDNQQGNIRFPTIFGIIVGSYLIKGQLITVEITEKPWVIGCPRIESEIKAALLN